MMRFCLLFCYCRVRAKTTPDPYTDTDCGALVFDLPDLSQIRPAPLKPMEGFTSLDGNSPVRLLLYINCYIFTFQYAPPFVALIRSQSRATAVVVGTLMNLHELKHQDKVTAYWLLSAAYVHKSLPSPKQYEALTHVFPNGGPDLIRDFTSASLSVFTPADLSNFSKLLSSRWVLWESEFALSSISGPPYSNGYLMPP